MKPSEDRAIITVENLGKKYRLDHQAERPRYSSLRDVLAEKAKRLFRPSNSRAERAEEFWALKDVSFEILPGDVVGIIGRNGAGKSTLLKILSRITEPTAGRVRLRGRIASLLEVGTGFHQELTGRENIFLNGAILGMTHAEIRSKFDEIVAFSEVEKFLDTPVKRYSSGMYVRLAFGVAAHLEPEILVVDEVLAVGDAEFQKKCLGKMQDVSKGGRTVLFVSHNMSAVQSLCTNAIVLEKGRMRFQGSIDAAIAEYLRSIRGSGDSDGHVISLGRDLRMTRLAVRPTTINSGDPVTFEMQLTPVRPIVLKEFALLLYSDFGVRLAVLDVRDCGPLNIGLTDAVLNVELSIKQLPLIEGDYRIGFAIATENYRGSYLDLLSFSVGALRDRRNTAPYAAQHRGYFELDFSSQMEVAPMVESQLQDR
jgi:lipopolysaccharide transport system ATP-binding protein